MHSLSRFYRKQIMVGIFCLNAYQINDINSTGAIARTL
jgi:hypothetical protein